MFETKKKFFEVSFRDRNIITETQHKCEYHLLSHLLPTHGPIQAQFNHMRRMQHTHAIAELFTLQYSRLDGPQDQLLDIPVDMELELAMILYTYRTVFDVPSGLPPSKIRNHSIPLVEGVGPVNVHDHMVVVPPPME